MEVEECRLKLDWDEIADEIVEAANDMFLGAWKGLGWERELGAARTLQKTHKSMKAWTKWFNRDTNHVIRTKLWQDSNTGRLLHSYQEQVFCSIHLQIYRIAQPSTFLQNTRQNPHIMEKFKNQTLSVTKEDSITRQDLCQWYMLLSERFEDVWV